MLSEDFRLLHSSGCTTKSTDMRLTVLKVNQLGDNVIFLPVVQWLQRLLPDTEMTIVTSPVAAPLYEKCTPGVRVLTADTKTFNGSWKHPLKLLEFYRLIRSTKPDACLLANDQGNVAHLLAWLSGAGVRVGPRESKCKLRPLLSHKVPLNLTDPVAVQNWHLARALLETLEVNCSAMPATPPAPDVSALGVTSRPDQPFVLIHPGASREYKRWPRERFVELANLLAATIEIRFITQGVAEEQRLSPAIRQIKLGRLEDFFALMKQASLFIGNNSGPMNIASVCEVPGIIFNGPSADHWLPMWHREKFLILRDPALSCQPCDKGMAPMNRCTNEAEPMACMRRISVESAERITLERLGLS